MKKIILILFVLISVVSCARKENRLDRILKELEIEEYEDLKDMSPEDAKIFRKRLEEISKDKIDELKAEIKKFKKIVDQEVKSSMEMGIYYKMVAAEYLFLEMYGLALENLEKALYIDPTNHLLLGMAGSAAANMGKITYNNVKRDEYYDHAAKYYKRALLKKPRYDDALYGLGILYGFELNEFNLSIEYLKKLVSLRDKRDDAKFALAYVYIRAGFPSFAMDMYNKIIAESKNKENINTAAGLLMQAEAKYGKSE